jgi:hypothetical protein
MSECERVNKHFQDVAARRAEEPVPECPVTHLVQEPTIDLEDEIDWEAWEREEEALEQVIDRGGGGRILTFASRVNVCPVAF